MRRLYRHTQLLIQGLAGLVFPRICILCRKGLREDAERGDYVCSSCWEGIKKSPSPVRLGPAGCTNTFDQVVSPALYEGTAKELIRCFKYHGKQHLGKQLSSLVVEGIRSCTPHFSGVDAVVPMPLHPRRRKEREFNQASILGQHIASALRLPLLEEALVRTRYTQAQATLDVESRLKNIAGCFTVPDSRLVRGKTLLLVDDVMTTGATVREAAGCLKRAGASRVYVATIAQ